MNFRDLAVTWRLAFSATPITITVPACLSNMEAITRSVARAAAQARAPKGLLHLVSVREVSR